MCPARRLLLPYECHVKGVLMSFPPQLQQRHFQPAKFGKDEGSGPLAASRRLIPVGHLHQVGAIFKNCPSLLILPYSGLYALTGELMLISKKMK